MKRKPTRRDLLIVIGRLQNLFGSVGTAASDQNPNRAHQLQKIAKRGLNVAVEALEQDDPVTPSGPWSDPSGEDEKWRAGA